MSRGHLFYCFSGHHELYKNVVLYSDIEKLKFGKTVKEKWREVLFDDLMPCTSYSFSIEALYKLPKDDGTEGSTNHSDPNTIIAETLCPSPPEEQEVHAGEDDYDMTEKEDTTTEIDIPTTKSPPIQPISNVTAEQTVQVLYCK